VHRGGAMPGGSQVGGQRRHSQQVRVAVDSRGRNHRKTMSHRRCRNVDCDVQVRALRKLAFNPSLYAENGEANAESECLPLTTDLLATCGAGGEHRSDVGKGNRNEK